MAELSLQDKYAPQNACFGCGPSNQLGLQIKSIPKGDMVVASWKGQKHHEAFPGMLNGGIIGALMDCHSNWSAAFFLMKASGLDTPPCTVTAYFNVSLKKPTPSNQELSLKANIIEIKEDRAKILCELYAGDELCAHCEGLFVAVKPGHPAYHRW